MRNSEYDLTIVGAGILGTAVADLASAAGWRVFIVRMSDEGRPRADTLRNQGWLQSGLLYPRADFRSEEDYEAFAMRTYFAGRELLRSCGLPTDGPSGIVATSKRERADELCAKAELLRLSPSEFRQLTDYEAKSTLGHFYRAASSYFRIPDIPFDGAAVLSHLRRSAEGNGAAFVVSETPVSLEAAGSCTLVRSGEMEVLSPLTFIAAGSGSVPLLAQIGHELQCAVRRTPLIVSHADCFLPASIYVDQDLGFSAVRHCCGPGETATVVGTRARTQPVVPVLPDHRTISDEERRTVHGCIHPLLREELGACRVTAGEELIPKTRDLTQYEPWVEEFGNVVFGSPGRATVTKLAAAEAMGRLNKLRNGQRNARTARCPPTDRGLPGWDAPIRMHFTSTYNFDDSENR